MPQATYTPLATYTAPAGGDAEIVFSNIPTSGYKDLVLVSSTRNSAYTAPFSQVRYRFNGDSGSNYSLVYAVGDGSGVGSGAVGSGTEITFFYSEPNTSSGFAVTISHFLDYNATDKHKTLLTRTNAPSLLLGAYASRWASTSAITSITVYTAPGYGSFVAGSTFSLYGIAG